MEVLEDVKTGKWEFDCVDMFTAATRIKPPQKQDAATDGSIVKTGKANNSSCRWQKAKPFL